MQSVPLITEPMIGKIKERLHFDESLFKTLVDFKRNDKEKT